MLSASSNRVNGSKKIRSRGVHSTQMMRRILNDSQVHRISICNDLNDLHRIGAVGLYICVWRVSPYFRVVRLYKVFTFLPEWVCISESFGSVLLCQQLRYRHTCEFFNYYYTTLQM